MNPDDRMRHYPVELAEGPSGRAMLVADLNGKA